MERTIIELLINDHWIITEIKSLRKGDVFRMNGYTYRAGADAEYWDENDQWGIMADYLGDLCGVNESDTK